MEAFPPPQFRRTEKMTPRNHIPKYAALLIALFVQCIAAFGNQMPFDTIGKEFANRPTSELRALASECISRMQPDSALALYSLASMRYNADLPRHEKEDCAVSTINMGYVCLFMLNNAEQAYPWIIKGMDICKKEGFDDYLPIATNYLAQIHYIYGDTTKALTLYRTAFRESAKREIWWSILMSYTELLTFAWQYGKLAEIEPEMNEFERLKIPAIPMSRYAVSLHKGMKATNDADYNLAESYFRQAATENDAESGLEHGDVINLIYIGETCYKCGKTGEAISLLRQAEKMMIKYKFWDLSSNIYGRLERYYRNLGNPDSLNHYHLKCLEIKDSIFNAERYGKIKDLEMAGRIAAYDADLHRISMERDQQRRNTLMAAIIASLIALIFIVVLIKNRHLNIANRHLYLRNIEILAEINSQKPQVTEEGSPETASDKEARSAVREENSEMISLMDRVSDILSTNAELFDPDFSIDRLAELAGSLPRYVSQAVNEVGKTDFRSLVATYRVREACRRLSEEAVGRKLTVESIAMEVGYKSRSHFSKVFKEVTGLSPSEFMRQAAKNN